MADEEVDDSLRERPWARYSDEELLSAEFTIADPSLLSGLLSDVPQGPEVPTLELAYDTGGSGAGKVRCVHCRYDNHNKGFVLRFKDGGRILVGNRCGLIRYGADFTAIRRDYDQATQRVFYLRQQRAAWALSAEIEATLDAALAHPAFDQFAELQRQVRTKMPAVWRVAVEAISRNEGVLTVAEKVRDHQAEVRRDERIEAQTERLALMSKTERGHARQSEEYTRATDRGRPIYMEVDRTIGVLDGPAFFDQRHGPVQLRLQQIRTRVAETLRELSAASLSTKALRQTLGRLRGEMTSAVDEAERLGHATAVFQERNLDVLTTAAMRQAAHGERYAGTGGKLVRFEGRDQTTISMPADYDPPTLHRLRELRDQIVAAGR